MGKISEIVADSICTYDARSTHYLDYEDRDTSLEARAKCSCDNCFYGRDRLAREIIKYLDVVDALYIIKSTIHFNAFSEPLKEQINAAIAKAEGE